MKTISLLCCLCLTIFSWAQDTTPPVAVCMDASVTLDASGNASITAADVDGGSTDEVGIASLMVTPSSFTCADVAASPISVTLVVTDTSGNTDSCTANVTVNELNDPVTAICQNIVVPLDSNGMATITPAMLDNGSTGSGSCGSLSFSASRTTFDCTDILRPVANSMVITGIVADSVPGRPHAIELYVTEDIADLTQYGLGSANDGGGSDGEEFTFPAGSANQGDFIYLAETAAPFTSFFGFNADYVSAAVSFDGDDAVELFFNGSVIDAYGEQNTDGRGEDWDYSDGWAYRVADTGPDGPTFVPTNWSYSGVNALEGQTTNPSVAMGGMPIGTYQRFGATSPTQVTLTVTNSNGSSDTCVATVTVVDTIAPTAACTDITVQLDANGEASILATDIDVSPADNCLLSIEVDKSSFMCEDLGTNTVTLTLTDFSNNTSTCTATVTVEDNVAPDSVCADIIVELDASGAATIIPDDIGNLSSDACGIVAESLDISSFDCSNIGPNTVTYRSEDGSGNFSTCTAIVTVQDNIAPNVICQDITVMLDSSGNATITAADVDNGSNDVCGIASRSIDITSFTCADIGTNAVVLTVTDVNGNSDQCTAQVTVVETIPPNTITKDITVEVAVGGSTVIAGIDVDDGSTDNCAIASYSVTPDTFSCADVGTPVTVTLTVTDTSGNFSTNTATVTVVDNVPPEALCQDITVQLDANGMASITSADVDAGSGVSCGTANITIDVNSFDCSDIGVNPVLLSVTNDSGVTRSCTAQVTVEDLLPPVVSCQDITLTLDAAGNASLVASDIVTSSSDNCGIASTQLDITSFDCTNVGSNTVNVTVTDNSGNSASCSAIVTVLDSQAPTVVCQNITIALDASGQATISANDVDGGSTDFCGIASTSIDITSFDCSNIGANNVTLTVTDISGNSSSCTAVVTVEDNTAPTVVCQNITLPLDASGSAFITATDLDGGSSDACGISSSTIIGQTIFNCANIGSNFVTLQVTDVNGNSSTCSAVVTVVDNTAPTVVCQNITVQLDATGTAFITANDIDGGSSDACGISFTGIDVNSFDCDDVGANNVILTVSDVNGNTETCTAIVTVLDSVDPVITCPSDQIETINSGEQFEVPDYVAIGLVTASDNCTNPLTNVSQTPAVGTLLDIGVYTVTTTVTDANGNSEDCSFQLTVDTTLGGIDQEIAAFSLFPNPSNDQVSLSNPSGIWLETLVMYDLSGRIVLEKEIKANSTRVDLSLEGLASAKYLLRIISERGTHIKQLLKE